MSPELCRKDEVLQSIGPELSSAAKRLRHDFSDGVTEHFVSGNDRLIDVRELVERAAAADDPASLATIILDRHTEVQRGKFDRGRRKLPWLEPVSGNITRTATRVGGLAFEARGPDAITPHPYRLYSADALIAAAGDA